MPRQGRELELILEKLHKVIDDDAIKIESPFYVKDIDTGEQRELDVGIIKTDPNGKIRLIGLDCRDRGATQDVRWVEELITKKISVGADVYYVVTSSKFTKPAQLKALKRGVILRRIDELPPEEIAEKFNDQYIEAHFVETDIEATNLECKGTIQTDRPVETLRIFSNKTGKYYSFGDMINEDSFKPMAEIDRKCHTHGEIITKTYKMLPENKYIEVPSKIIGEVPKKVRIHSYIMELTVKKFVEKVPLSALKEYRENQDDTLLGEIIEYGDLNKVSIDKQKQLAKFFINVSHMPKRRFFTRMKFSPTESYSLSEISLKRNS